LQLGRDDSRDLPFNSSLTAVNLYLMHAGVSAAVENVMHRGLFPACPRQMLLTPVSPTGRGYAEGVQALYLRVERGARRDVLEYLPDYLRLLRHECQRAIPGDGVASPSPVTAKVTFTVVRCPPPTKEECKDGGWEEFGFPDQGRCVSAVNRENRENRL
jgi:hypothetical protein